MYNYVIFKLICISPQHPVGGPSTLLAILLFRTSYSAPKHSPRLPETIMESSGEVFDRLFIPDPANPSTTPEFLHRLVNVTQPLLAGKRIMSIMSHKDRTRRSYNFVPIVGYL
jgi:hypothetical protein